MTKKTIVEKAAEAVGFSLAMAEDVAGAIKTAIGAGVTSVLEKAPVEKNAAPKKAVKKVLGKKAAKKTAKKVPAKKAVKKSVRKKSGRLRH